MSEGWATLPPSRTAHYFAGSWSLCRRVSPAPSVLAPSPPDPTCGECRRTAALRQRMGRIEPMDLDGRRP